MRISASFSGKEIPLKSHFGKRVLAAMVMSAGLLAGSGCAHKQAYVPTVVEIPARSFTTAWTADLDSAKDPVEAMYVRDDYIFVYTHSRMSYVLSRSGGQLLHGEKVVPAGSQLLAPVILKDRIVYPTTATLEVYDLHGKKQKSVDIGAPFRSGAVGSGSIVYVGTDTSNGGRVSAVDMDRPYGPVKWELMTFGGLSGAPALFQGALYIGAEDGRVYAVNEERNPLWSLSDGVFLTGNRITGDVKADEFGVYIACTDSKLYCIDRGTGRLKWQYFATAPLTTGPQITKDMVFQFVPNRGLAAVPKTTGDFNRKAAWVLPEATMYLAEDDKYAYVRLRGNILGAVDKTTGEVKFRSKRSDLDVFGINIKDGIIYAATKRGEVLAIKPVLKPGSVGELVEVPIEGAFGG
jgi:outer membrane protein assembly factor BamB